MKDWNWQVKPRQPLGRLIRRRAKDYGMTLKDVARAAGINRIEIYKILNDETRRPNIKTRRGICRALEIDAAVLDRAIREREDAEDDPRRMR